MTLLFELWDGASWKRVFSVEPGQTPGTISNNTGQRREVLFFETAATESTISRASTDNDIEAGALRAVLGADLQPVATLTDGQAYELLVRTDRMVGAQLCRFRHYAGKTQPSTRPVRSQPCPPQASASSSASRRRTA